MKKTSFIAILTALLLTGNIASAALFDNPPEELRLFIESDLDSIHFKSMKTHAVPLKILLTAMILEGRSRKWIAKDSLDFKVAFKHAGLTYPEKVIFNNKAYRWSSTDLPMGLVKREMDFGINANVKFVNLSCTACHAGSEYNQNGKRLNNIVVGSASESFNPEIYVTLIYEGMKKINLDWSSATKIMNTLFPDTSIREKLLFQTILKNQIKSYMKDHAAIDRATPFLNGGPGLTNGIASLKNVLEISQDGSSTGYTSIPSLADRAFRSSLLYDGIYSPANKNPFQEVTPDDKNLKEMAIIVSLFTIPTMGETPKGAIKKMANVIKTVTPILKKYKTPEFPGSIDSDKARVGQNIYQNNCMECHGAYEWAAGKKAKMTSFPNKFVPQKEMNSDPQRWLAVSDNLVEKMQETDWVKYIDINQNKGYVAPILEGVWASAPYLHNGSVPTLWHLLRPSQRPTTFMTGDQNLDFVKVGIANIETSFSEVYNTSLEGRRNTGHESQFNQLSEQEKDNLLEFLKVL